MQGKGRRRSLLSGAPERRWPDAAVHHGARWLVLLLLGAGLVALYPSDPVVGVGRYRAGTVADRDLIAQVGFPVPKDAALLARERAAAAASVIPTFIYRESARDSALAGLERFFARIDSAARAGGAAGIGGVLSTTGIDASAEQVELLADGRVGGRLRSDAAMAIGTLTPGGVMAPGAASALTTDSIRVVSNGAESVVARNSVLSGREFYDRAVAGRDPDPETDLLRMILGRFLAASLVPDVARTNRDMTTARDTVQIMEARVLEDEAIVRANDPVGEAELRKLEAYRAQLRVQGINVDGSNVEGALGGLILNAVLLAVFGVLLFYFRPEVYRSFRSVVAIAGIFTVYLVSASFIAGLGVPPAALPIVFVAVSLSVLWDGRLALLAVFVLSSLTVLQEPFAAVHIFVTVLSGGAAAALSVRAFRRLAQTWVFIAITAGVYALVIMGLQLRGADFAFIPSLAWALLSTVTGAILAIGFLPVFEWLTGITTDQTLIGWADANRPLMRRLAVDAPGTFAHTMQVANLAEAGAGAIGANELLCRAGIYYHDVGKTVRPGYFIENQHGDNPHDHLDPRESATIVRNHVVEGVNMARNEKVPEVLVDFISEHHGDQTISFFLRQAREQAEEEGTEPPDPELFRYPGPRPQSRETAIAMLADSVESAARALKDPTEARILALIEDIVAGKAESGQLDEAPLTFRDLALLKARFAKVLGGIHHQRIDYPGTRHLTERTGPGIAGQ